MMPLICQEYETTQPQAQRLSMPLNPSDLSANAFLIQMQMDSSRINAMRLAEILVQLTQ